MCCQGITSYPVRFVAEFLTCWIDAPLKALQPRSFSTRFTVLPKFGRHKTLGSWPPPAPFLRSADFLGCWRGPSSFVPSLHYSAATICLRQATDGVLDQTAPSIEASPK